MSVIDLTFDDDDGGVVDDRLDVSMVSNEMEPQGQSVARPEVLEVDNDIAVSPIVFQIASHPPTRKRKRPGTQTQDEAGNSMGVANSNSQTTAFQNQQPQSQPVQSQSSQNQPSQSQSSQNQPSQSHQSSQNQPSQSQSSQNQLSQSQLSQNAPVIIDVEDSLYLGSDDSQAAIIDVDSDRSSEKALVYPQQHIEVTRPGGPRIQQSYMQLDSYQAQRPATTTTSVEAPTAPSSVPFANRTQHVSQSSNTAGQGAPVSLQNSGTYLAQGMTPGRRTQMAPTPAVSTVPDASNGNGPSGHMRMIGQLRAVAVISTGSTHYRQGSSLQIPTTLRNRQGSAQEVELFDSDGRLIGTLEQSVTKAIFAMQMSGHIRVMGMTAGPLRGKFVSPILLSFYASEQLALGVIRLLEQAGLYLDQSATETQTTLRELNTESNTLTAGMNYIAHHPTRDDDGLMTGRTNSDGSLPSVFTNMNFTVDQFSGGGGGEEIPMPKVRHRQIPLPESMRVVKRPEQTAEDSKTRLADIKSTFVTLLDLPETDAPAQITTALRRHQKQALFFMVHRETEGVDVENPNVIDIDGELNFPKLWLVSQTSGQSASNVYRHALVDVRCIGRPRPLLGGILADDMGLGKTLAVLALVVKLPPVCRLGSRVKFADGSASPTRDQPVQRRRRSAPRARGRQGSKRTRLLRGVRAKKSQQVPIGRGVGVDSSNESDSDSFTAIPPAKRVRREHGSASSPDVVIGNTANRIASQPPIAVLSDSDYLTDDPLESALRSTRKRPRLGRRIPEVVVVRRDNTENIGSISDSDLDLDSDLDSSSSGHNDSDSEADSIDIGYVSDGRPMTPPPEFDNMATRRKDECERRFSENYRGRYAGGTLIVCPLSTMGNWEEQVATHMRPRSLIVHAYHGHARCKKPKKLSHYDIVLTTFNVLQAEYARETRQLLVEDHGPTENSSSRLVDSSSEEESSTKLFQVPEDPYVSPLLAVRWHRVVLDEAHNIKERRTISSIAAYSLHAERRWCLTGTPIQNRLDDLYSLLRFLHVTPVDNWRVWLTYIGAPFHKNIRTLTADGESMEEGNIGANRVQRLMQSICLRRMKRQIDAKTNRTMIELPPKFETVRWLELADGERRLYNMAEEIARNKFSNMSRNGTLLKNYIHILKIILRLRQLCTHPRLWSDEKWHEARTLLADNAIAGSAQPAAAASTALGKPAARVPRLASEPRAKREQSASTSTDSKPKREAVPADPCSIFPASHDQFFDRWADEVRVHGTQTRCEFCQGYAVPPALQQQRDFFAATDYPGAAVTKCMHIMCCQCQVVLFGAAPSTPQEEEQMRTNPAMAALSECMLCGDLLSPTDIIRIPAQHLFRAITRPAGASGSAVAVRSAAAAAAGPVSAASLASSVRSDHLRQQQLDDLPAPENSMDHVENSYSELNRLCSEQDTSTKIITLLSDIDKIRKRAWFADPVFEVDQQDPFVVARQAELAESPGIREKCVVFSQWTTMLDLIEPLLSQQGIRFTRLDGKMQRPQRERNLHKFKHDRGIEVLLLSLRAGGVGLNLVHATHVFLMDAFWNPSVENQAIDRIHRLGQCAPVTVTRYFIKNSIEEKIMMLQRRKAKIVDISLMDSSRTARPNADASFGDVADSEEMLAITTGTHSRQQRLNDLNLLLG
ncbi:hypothetical protein H4R24_004913 [Coemansia sp. RSA 988]|nr:hypothetical protein H4R24_004913 [Coemansia sp. RSA 988]